MNFFCTTYPTNHCYFWVLPQLSHPPLLDPGNTIISESVVYKYVQLTKLSRQPHGQIDWIIIAYNLSAGHLKLAEAHTEM
jgi:hypothetical protein